MNRYGVIIKLTQKGIQKCNVDSIVNPSQMVPLPILFEASHLRLTTATIHQIIDKFFGNTLTSLIV